MSESMLTAAFIILSGGLQDAYTYLCRGKAGSYTHLTLPTIGLV